MRRGRRRQRPREGRAGPDHGGAGGRRTPSYGWEENKGYSAPEHGAAIRRLGPCAQHRQSWSLPGQGGDLDAAADLDAAVDLAGAVDLDAAPGLTVP